MSLILLLLFVILLFVCFSAWAAEAPPISWDGMRQLGPVLLIAVLGGLVAFIGKMRAGASRMFNFSEFIGDMFTAAVTGMFFYWLCRGIDANQWVTAAIVGMGGHAGSRGIFMLEKWAEKKLDEIRIARP